MVSLITLLFSSLLWGFFDLIRKKALEYLSITQIVYLIFISQTIIFLISLIYSNLIILSNYYFIYLAFIVILNLIGLYCFLKAIKIQQISMSIPLLSYSPLFSVFFSSLILNESLLLYQYFGITIIFIGSFVLYSKSLRLKDLLFSPFTLISNKGAQLIITVALIWSLVPVLDKKSLYYIDIYFHGFLQSLFGILLLLIFIKTPKIKAFKVKNINKHLFLVLMLIIISFLATIIQLVTIQINYIAILEVFKRSVGIILSLFFGYIFFKERINFQKILSIIIIICGLIFVI